MSRVFVVQNQHRWDAPSQQFVPKYDLSPAAEYGELTFLLGPTASPMRPAPLIAEIREKLAGYSVEDYLLMVGNPALISAVAAIASFYSGGKVKVLQWSGKDQRYISILLSGLNTEIPFSV